MRRKYDFVISLGEKCFVAQTLSKMGIRQFSGPFDWLEIFYGGTGGGIIDRLNLIINKFQNFFNKEDLIPIYENNYRFFVNSRTNLSFRHDFSQTDDFNEKFAYVAEKYDRRCNRLINILNSKKRVLFVYCNSCFKLDNINLIIQKVKELNKAFNTSNIDLIVINSDKNLKRKNHIKYDRINRNIKFISGVDLYKPIKNTDPKYYILTLSTILKKFIKTKIKQQNIISLTSYPARINIVSNVIKTLLNQTVMPDKIVLYLSKNEFHNKKLPSELINMQNNIFEIRFVEKNYKSFNKLIHALYNFPFANIITVDDDILYPRTLVYKLLKTHKKHPNDICANRIRYINIINNEIQPYVTWALSEKRSFIDKKKHDYKNFFCGVGGVLYPPRSLYKDVFDSEKFTKLCSRQDDVWFWAMAVQNNRKISVTRYGYNLKKRTIREAQSIGLWNTVNNTEASPNNIAINNIIKEYPDIAKKIGLK